MGRRIVGILSGGVLVVLVLCASGITLLFGVVTPSISAKVACEQPAQIGSTPTTLNVPTSEQLNSSQMDVAQQAVGAARGYPDTAKNPTKVFQALIIGGMQESSLREDPVKNDRDSEGFLSQRRSIYGPFVSIADATKKFLVGLDGSQGHKNGLFDIAGWETMPVGRLVQTVQISAYPDAYDRWVPMANEMLRGLDLPQSQTAVDVDCGLMTSGGLPPAVDRVRAFLFAQIGDKYVLGGNGPDEWDCSGLMVGAAKVGGFTLPRTADQQFRAGPAVAGASPSHSIEERLKALSRGDLVFWDLDAAVPGADHVGWYDGTDASGQPVIINAPNKDNPVRVQPMYWDGYVGATDPFAVGRFIPSLTQWGYPLPTKPTLSSPFGMRFHPVKHIWKLHDGADFGAVCGTDLLGMNAGTVSAIGYDANGNGNFLQITYLTGDKSVYAHMSEYAPGVGIGSSVRTGQVVGSVGTTGSSTGCHLHLTIYKRGGTLVDPIPFMQERGLSVN